MKRFPRYLLWVGISTIIIACMSGDISLSFVLGVFLGAISIPFPSKPERERQRIEEEKKAAELKRKKEQEEEERKRKEAAKNAPGTYHMDNVDILTFSSQNNIITAGNNWIKFKLRNRNPYDVIVAVRYKYAGGWESDYHTFQVAGNSIRTVDTSGKAWNKATDITLVYVS